MSESASEPSRDIDPSFLDRKVSETEDFWQQLVENGSVQEIDKGIVLKPQNEDVERFTHVTADDNFAHVKGKHPERSRKLLEMLEESTQYTEPVIPEGYPEAGSYRPLQQGALTPTAIAYDPHLGFDGLLTDIELSFREPVFAGPTKETADKTSIVRNGDSYDIAAVNPWKDEEYIPTEINYETTGEGDFEQENKRRLALMNALVAREPLENGESPRDGDIFHEADASYPPVLDETLAYSVDAEEVTDTALGSMKVFEVEEELESGDFSYTETYIDASV